jgi:hypothetical protein
MFCTQPGSITDTEMQVKLDGEFYGENDKCLKNNNRKNQDRNPFGRCGRIRKTRWIRQQRNGTCSSEMNSACSRNCRKVRFFEHSFENVIKDKSCFDMPITYLLQGKSRFRKLLIYIKIMAKVSKHVNMPLPVSSKNAAHYRRSFCHKIVWVLHTIGKDIRRQV